MHPLGPGGRSAPSPSPFFYRSDPLLRTFVDRWRVGPVGVAIATALAGFGLMAAWYALAMRFQPELRPLRGLYDFYTASWGDALLLPLINLLTARYWLSTAAGLERELQRRGAPIQAVRSLAARIDRPLVTVAIAALALGLAAFLGWRDTLRLERNWTLPELGRIGAAGVYHQLFVALQAYVLAYVGYRHIATLRAIEPLAAGAAEYSPLSLARDAWSRFSLIVLCWSVFTSLRLMDHWVVAGAPTLGEFLSHPRPRELLAGYFACWLGLAGVPGLLSQLRLGRGVCGSWCLILLLTVLVPFLGPLLLAGFRL